MTLSLELLISTDENLHLTYFPELCKILALVSIVLKNNKVSGRVYGRLPH